MTGEERGPDRPRAVLAVQGVTPQALRLVCPTGWPGAAAQDTADTWAGVRGAGSFPPGFLPAVALLGVVLAPGLALPLPGSSLRSAVSTSEPWRPVLWAAVLTDRGKLRAPHPEAL